MSDGNGALPEGWERGTLGTITHIRTGKLDANAADEDGAYPFFTCADDISRINEFAFDTEAVLLAGNGGFNVKWYQGKFNAYQRTYVIEPEGVSGRFLYHLIRYEIPEITEKNRGSTIKYLRLGDIADCNIELPPLAEQRRIVSKIESLQERSSRARRALSEVGPLLEQFRQSVLRAAFSGRLTADWRAAHRDVEPATELLSRIRTERRHRWEQSELAKYEAKGKQPPKNWQDKYKQPQPVDEANLPDLPEGWCWGVMEELCTNIVDCPHSTPKWTEEGMLCVRTTEFRAGYLDLSKVKYVSAETFEKRIERLKPATGDVLYSREGGILGIACQIPRDVELCLGQRMMLMRPESCINSTLVMHWLNSPFIFIDHVQSKIQGAASPHINVGEVKRFPIPIAPEQEQAVLAEAIREGLELLDSVIQLRAESESSLTQLDQSILAKAFRGELVPQDPRDEPASELLARIRTTREAEEPTKPKRQKKKSAVATLQPTATPPTPATVQRSLPIEPQAEPLDQSLPVKKQPAHPQETPVPIDETDRNDLMASIRSVFSAHSEGLNREDAIRHLAHELGYKRTGSRIQEIVGNDLIAAQKRHIIHRDGDRYYLACRSIEDYDRDDLVSLLQRAMGNTWWEESEAIKEATRLLGFRRTGRNITDTWKKTIALAIRRGELERSGTELRRCK